ncbi:MAG: glycoside hydrolase family 38 C-terminal domain-containing protein [Anaerolineae bacterium]|nr:glycoside hydrolase family 38 C-terminal domain-containing protein [Anaerolineae bacterium]
MPAKTSATSGFRAVPTPLVTHAAPVAERAIVLQFPVARVPRPARALLVVGDRQVELDLGVVPPGETMAQVLVPEVAASVEARADLRLGDEAWGTTFTLAPARPWTVYVVPHSHTDIGFTHPASEVACIHDENTDEAVALCDLTRDWPDGSRFKWTCEVSWQIGNYLRSRPAPSLARLQDCLRRGQMEVAAIYAGLHTDICGLEELARSLYLATRLRREWGIAVDTAMICDVPGATWAYAQVLARAGIRYLIVADNNFSAPFLPFTDLPRPFRWEAPDGSRVLAWYTDDPFWAYIEGYKLGFGESYRHVLRALPLKLAELEEQGYPYDAYQLQLASDNCRVPFRPALIARQWQERWANPRVRIATAREFLVHVDATCGVDLPVRRGDWTNWWSSTVLSFPHETALGRRVKEDLTSAEKLGAWANATGILEYPAALIAEGYDRLLAFDEHSGGGGLWRPKSEEEQIRALHEGYAFPHQAAEAASAALEAAVSALAGAVPNPRHQHALLVLNTLSWDRTDVVDARLPEGAAGCVPLDPDTGRPLPVQALPSGAIRFLAPGVPSVGYRAFPLVAAEAPEATDLSVGEHFLENRYYRVELDERGRIASIVDREHGRDLVAGGAAHGFGELLWYEPRPHREFRLGDEFPDQVELYQGLPVPGEVLPTCEAEPTVRIGARGPVSASLLVERQVDGPFHLRQEVVLHAGLRRVEISYLLAPEGEARAPKTRLAYLHFPFGLDAPRFTVELPGALLAPEEDQLKGACRDFLAAQHWLGIHSSRYTLLLSTPDTPLVELGRQAPCHQQFLRRWHAESAAVWVPVLSLSPAHGATDSPYSRNAPLRLRFSLTSHAGPLDPGLAMRHGWGACNPLIASALAPGQGGTLPPGRCSWCELTPGHVLLVTAKRPEDGDGLIFRLWEASGQGCVAGLSLPHLRSLAAWRCSVVEEEIAPLEVRGHTVCVPIAGFGIETVRIRRVR